MQASLRDFMRISIHALREEGDEGGEDFRIFLFISIHALREEGDFSENFIVVIGSNFYPRPPRGGRPAPSPMMRSSKPFLSTPSARRATANC